MQTRMAAITTGRNPAARWLGLGGALLSVAMSTLLLFAPRLTSSGQDSYQGNAVWLLGPVLVLSVVVFPLVYGLCPFFAYRWTTSERDLAYGHLAPKLGIVTRRLDNVGFTGLRRTRWFTVASRAGRGCLLLPRYLEAERGRGRLEFALAEGRLVLVRADARH
ncbi:hypothetical protein DRW03_35840 [Corallococcus sp. H22C18031201]|nr:hypothetical protein DRW03_35840 [Corallococcus sp. H22C18031201]